MRSLLIRFSVIDVICILAVLAIRATGAVTNSVEETSAANLNEQRRAFQIQKPIFPAITVKQKFFYDASKNFINETYARTYKFSPIFRGYNPPLRKDGAQQEDPRIRWNVSELIQHASSNFQPEIHKVVTKDGYILTVFRIINKASKNTEKEPIFFQHGFLGSAADWLLLDTEYNLPFIFAAAGYDVWLGNSRGNKYSQEHKRLSREDPEYWNFSFDELAMYDLPAVFDYILERQNTNEKKLTYVGYELGTTLYYACLSRFPENNKKIKFMVALGPTAYLSSSRSLAKNLIPYKNLYFKDGPLIPSLVNSFLRFTKPILCEVYKHGRSLCSNALAHIFGPEENDRISKKTISRVFGHYPDTTSFKMFVHVLQLLSEDRFRQFDYKLARNFKKYGQIVPPKYDMLRIQTDVLNYYGKKDFLLDSKVH